jgi:hypothetical protein
VYLDRLAITQQKVLAGEITQELDGDVLKIKAGGSVVLQINVRTTYVVVPVIVP